MEAIIWVWTTKWPRLSTAVYNSVKGFVEFKADMHHVYIRAWKDLEKKWTTLPFIVIDDTVFVVHDMWPHEWHALDLVARDEMEIQIQKAILKSLVQQKRNEQLAEEVRASREVAKVAMEKIAIVGGTLTQDERGPKLTVGKRADNMTEGMDLSTTSTPLKWTHVRE